MSDLPYVEETAASRLRLIASILRESGQYTIADEIERAAGVLDMLTLARKQAEQGAPK